MKAALRRALGHAEERRQFGRSIIEFEMIKEKFAEVAVEIYGLESMVYLASGLADRGIDVSLEAAICKVYGTEAMWRAANHAVQVAGGSGFMREYPYERIVRDSRVNMIFEGTNEILRVMIALTGMQRRGEYLRQVGEALKSPLEKAGVLGEYAADRIRKAVSPARLTFAPEVLGTRRRRSKPRRRPSPIRSRPSSSASARGSSSGSTSSTGSRTPRSACTGCSR